MQSCIGFKTKMKQAINHTKEVMSDHRFKFGANWSRFLKVLADERITEAEKSLKTMLGVENLEGKSFLDVGSGSGLFSLAARRLGARVHSFDYDPQSVACTRELKRRYFPNDTKWAIGEGSVLKKDYMNSLAKFDIVYAWGVLHHTGAMWQALEIVRIPVQKGGRLFISIYNDQGHWSAYWKYIKRIYNSLPRLLKLPFALLVMVPRDMKSALYSFLTLQPLRYIRSWTQYKSSRGMSKWYDIIDWVGGYPFEVAKPEEVFAFYRKRGFLLEKLKTCSGEIGCNEFVFIESSGDR
jgi:2-polyprenyl-6-hydroxyphenyl methylase/3-demethylubiquinone-9 3-methyltransferase